MCITNIILIMNDIEGTNETHMEVILKEATKSDSTDDLKKTYEITSKYYVDKITETQRYNPSKPKFESLIEYLELSRKIKDLNEFNDIWDKKRNFDRKNQRYQYYFNDSFYDYNYYPRTYPSTVAEYKQLNPNSLTHMYVKRMLNRYENETNNNDNNIYDIIDPCKYLYTYFTLKKNKFTKYDLHDKNYYRCLPCVFRRDDGLYKCKLVSNIVNVNQYKYKNTVYKCIEMVFNKMINMFEGILKRSLRNIDLNVIVKCFDLCNNADTEYIRFSGWNTISNNVTLYGLYVYDVNNIMDGNEIMFRTLVDRDLPNITNATSVIEFLKLPLKEGLCLVFNNIKVYHQYTRAILKKSNKNGHCKILSFCYVYDRGLCIPNALNITCNWEYNTKKLISVWYKLTNTVYNDGIYQLLCQFIMKFVIGDSKHVQYMYKKFKHCAAVSKHRKKRSWIESEGYDPIMANYMLHETSGVDLYNNNTFDRNTILSKKCQILLNSKEMLIDMLKYETELRLSDKWIGYSQNEINQWLNTDALSSRKSVFDPQTPYLIQLDVAKHFGFNNDDDIKNAINIMRSARNLYSNDNDIINAANYLKFNRAKQTQFNIGSKFIDIKLKTLNNDNILLSNLLDNERPNIIISGSIT